MGIVLVKEIQREEGIDGLKDRTKSGRPPRHTRRDRVYEIKNELASNRQGWTTKQQIEDLIVRKRVVGNQTSLYSHIYRLMHKWGFKQKVPRRVHVNTASKEEKERFKKEQERYYWIISTSSRSSSSSRSRSRKDSR